MAEHAERAFWRCTDDQWLTAHGDDFRDIQIAFDRACASGNADAAGAIALALRVHLHLRNTDASLHRRVEALHSLLPSARAPLTRARIWTFLSAVQMVAVPGACRGWREVGSVPDLAEALAAWGIALAAEGDSAQADQARSEALSLVSSGWPVRRRWRMAEPDAWVTEQQGDAQAFRAKIPQVVALAETAGARRAMALWRLELAALDIVCGAQEAALDALASCMPLLESLRLPSAIYLARALLCTAHLLKDDLPAATQWSQSVLESAEPVNLRRASLEPIALLAAQVGLPSEAARLIGASNAWLGSFAGRRGAVAAMLEQRIVAAVEEACGPAELARLRAAGALMDESDAFDFAQDVLRQVSRRVLPPLSSDPR